MSTICCDVTELCQFLKGFYQTLKPLAEPISQMEVANMNFKYPFYIYPSMQLDSK